MPTGKQQTFGYPHQDASASLMSLARVLARQAVAEQISASASKDRIPSPVPTHSEEHGDAPTNH